jgi:EmrB/QacA subfamily drug resistance transporter
MTAVSRPSAVLAVASFAAVMTSIDSGVLMTGIPSLRAEFGGSVGELEWTTNAYNLAFGCLLIVAAGLGDRLGRRLVLLLGVGLFGVASVGAALAPSLAWLIFARAVQGVGAAAILPLTLTMISAVFSPETRGRAIGIWSGILAGGGVAGAVVSGVLVQLTGWRGAFWINVPIAIALVPLVRKYLAESHGPAKRLDPLGLVLAGLGSLGIAWGLSGSTDDGWLSPVVIVPLIAGCGILVLFAVWERRASEPMMPLSLLRNRRFGAANFMIFSMWGSLALCVFLMSQFFQIAQHTSALGAGLRFSIWPIPVALVPMIGGRLLARVSPRLLIPVGMALHALGLVGLALVINPTTPYAYVAILMVVSGIGLGMSNGFISAQAMSAPPPDLIGVASGVSSTLRQIGAVLGLAIGAAVFANGGGSYRDPASFAQGFVAALWAAATIAILGLVVALVGVPSGAKPRSATSLAGNSEAEPA